MKITEFIEKVEEQFDEVNPSQFTENTKFKELDEWSSLVALSIIAMIDEECDYSLSSEDLQKSDTIKDLYNCLSC